MTQNENLNLKEILKDCPKGTKFYSSIYGDVYFEEINDFNKYHPIRIKIDMGRVTGVTIQGLHDIDYKGECTLFPSKYQRDWSKWHRPFIDGDVVTFGDQIAIFKKYISEDSGLAECYVFLDIALDLDIECGKYYVKDFATEDERKKLFDTLKSKGCKWNPETKTLENLIEPKFKVGDKITEIGGSRNGEIFYIDEDKYHVAVSNIIGIDVFFKDQDNWELYETPNVFDPNTLIPFESKVLVRDANHSSWIGSIYTHRKEKANGFYTVNGICYCQCIPYNDDTAYLIGTYKDAPKYYKYWEE